jgi:hypothetical protein
MNTATFIAQISLFAWELHRENWLIQRLTINPHKADQNLMKTAPDAFKQDFFRINKRHWMLGIVGLVLSIANILVSGVYFRYYWVDDWFSLIQLFMLSSYANVMVMWGSWGAASQGKGLVVPSLYLKGRKHFNVIDTKGVK